jgi:hypothetical protein
MTSNRILELMNRTPFMPLEIHLSDGTTIRVEDPFDIAVRPHSPDFTVFEEERWRFVACRNIREVITAPVSRP